MRSDRHSRGESLSPRARKKGGFIKTALTKLKELVSPHEEASREDDSLYSRRGSSSRHVDDSSRTGYGDSYPRTRRGEYLSSRERRATTRRGRHSASRLDVETERRSREGSPSVSLRGEPRTGQTGRRGNSVGSPSVLKRVGQAMLVAWLAVFGAIYRLSRLGPKKLGILFGCAALIIAIPITVVALASGKKENNNKWGFSSDPSFMLASAVTSSPGAESENTPAFAEETPSPTPTATPTPSPTPEPHPTNMVIGKGIEAPVVAEIQTRLMKLGYMEDDEPTQYYGNITESSIILFQRQHGLSMDGKVGLETWNLLMSDQATKYTVMLGADGADVRELQIRLRELGYIESVTGHFGELTEAAVKRFQELNGLSVDGKVGSQTREALYSEKSKPNMMKYGENNEEIKGYQELLKKLGYLTTTPDGNYGGDTKAAVMRFQELNGLIPDGFLGYNTIKTLKSSSAAPNALKLGMKGSDVENMQKLLKKLGYTSAVTGYFGEITEEAVKSFQKQNKLSVDGTVGKATMNLLTSDKAKKAPATTTKAPGASTTTKPSDSTPSSSSRVDKLIQIARSKLGASYVYATKGPNTFDCSGFVYYCLKESGVSVSYLTSSGWASTDRYQKIRSMSDIKKGDILVFSGTGSTGHVGIYIGGGEMIDASSGKGRVKVTSINIDYWRSHFICAHRVF